MTKGGNTVDLFGAAGAKKTLDLMEETRVGVVNQVTELQNGVVAHLAAAAEVSAQLTQQQEANNTQTAANIGRRTAPSVAAIGPEAGLYSITSGPEASQVWERPAGGGAPVRRPELEAASAVTLSAVQSGYTARVDALAALDTYGGPADTLIVSENNRGGTFALTPAAALPERKRNANGGTRRKSLRPDMFWVRRGPKNYIDLAWFVEPDQITDAGPALIAALAELKTSSGKADGVLYLGGGDSVYDGNGAIYRIKTDCLLDFAAFASSEYRVKMSGPGKLQIDPAAKVQLQNASNLHADLVLQHGGAGDDYTQISRGIVLAGLRQSVINISAKGYQGRVLDIPYARTGKLDFCEINLKTWNCGQSFSVGPGSPDYAAAFGMLSVWETEPRYGSVARNLADLKMPHYDTKKKYS